MTPPKLLTVREVAQYLDVSPMTVHRLTRRGELFPVRVGGSVRYTWAEIERYVQENTMPNGAKLGKKDVRIKKIATQH